MKPFNPSRMKKPTPAPARYGHGKTGTLTGLTAEVITARLGFAPNSPPSPDGKVRVQWDFMVGGCYCSIWDYKGSAEIGQFSTYGSAVVLTTLFPREWH